jgi:phenylpropionate dioxygenase-like ring-hydroxylating dioxygenase large terminal subunit
MIAPIDPVARHAWYPLAVDDGQALRRRTTLLGEPVALDRETGGAPAATDGEGRRLPVVSRHGHLWTTLGEPGALFDIPEAREPGRRFVPCGRVTIRASGLRVVENFLDMAHFPFVHPGILGDEAEPEVKPYRVEIVASTDEVWATECVFHQPRAALSASGGVEAAYRYRVPSPFVAMLYKTCPARPDALDVVGIFLQPRHETLTDVFPFYYVFDEENGDAEIAEFQQMIFLQDKSIVENQIPPTLPLDVGAEIPTRADASSVAYRRWLKAKGLTFGVTPTRDRAA